jgi:hypothetical protein
MKRQAAQGQDSSLRQEVQEGEGDSPFGLAISTELGLVQIQFLQVAAFFSEP